MSIAPSSLHLAPFKVSASAAAALVAVAALIAAPASIAHADTPDTGAEAGAGGAAKTKILVLPFQAIYRSVEQPKLNKATDYLFKELDQKGDVEIVRGAAGGAKSEGPSLAGAEAAAKAAGEAEKARRLDTAIAEWQKAIAAYEANAAAIQEPGPYWETYLRLARAFWWAGRDKEAEQTLDVLARMAPGLDPEHTEYSRLFRRNLRKIAEKIVTEKGGKLLVKSALPGATVTIDGRPMPVAPVLLERVVPGKHLILVQVPGVPAFGALATVVSGQQAELRSSFAGTAGGSSVGKVTDAIAENTLGKDVVEAAAAAGKEAGAAFVVLGAMSSDGGSFRVHTFVVEAASQKVHAIEKQKFDLELLTAESEVLRIVNAARAAFSAFPASATAALGPIDPAIKVASTVTNADASPSLLASASTAKGPAKAAGPRTVVKAAKESGVKIKDEPKD